MKFKNVIFEKVKCLMSFSIWCCIFALLGLFICLCFLKGVIRKLFLYPNEDLVYNIQIINIMTFKKSENFSSTIGNILELFLKFKTHDPFWHATVV